MDEQDHANPNSKLIAAIFRAAQFYSAEDAEKLVGALSEFVRGIVREEVGATGGAYQRCICPMSATAPVATNCPVHWPNFRPRCTCLADWKASGGGVPVSSTCPAHGMGRSTPHTHSTVIE